MIRPSVLSPSGAGIDSSKRERRSSRALAERSPPETRQRQGKALGLGGWLLVMVGVVVYCAASFAAEPNADLAATMLHGAAPATRAGLLMIGVGTLTWIVGLVRHSIAALDADAGDPGTRGE